MLKKIIAAIAGLYLSLGVAPAVYADGHALKLTTSVNVNQNGSGQVKHIFDASGSDKNPLPEQAELSVYGRNIKSLRARAQDGGELVADYDENNQTVTVDVPSGRRRAASRWSFTVSYSSDVLTDLGSSQSLQLSSLATNLDITRQTVNLAADLELGFASVRGPKPSKTSIGVGQQIISFTNSKGPIKSSPLLIFGEQTQAQLTFDTTLKNRSFWWQDVELTLPPDTNQQRTQLMSIEPKPKNVKLDRDGNMLAVYRLGPRQSVNVTAVVELSLSVFNYKLEQAGSVEQADQILKDRYTSLTDVWQPIGLEIDENGSDAGALVKAVFDGVIERARQDESDVQLELASRSGALKYSDWLVGELRSRGLPARVVVGLLGSDGNRLSEEFQPHAWAEAYVPGTGWVTLDPWLSLRTGDFAGSDPLHLALGLWGIETDRPPIDTGALSVAYADEASQPPTIGDNVVLAATKHVWLPFISTLSISATFPNGVIVDEAILKSQSAQDIALGSLAPGQTVTRHFARLGAEAFSHENASIGQQTADGFTVWQEARSQISYTPFILLVFALLLALAVWFWRRRRNQRRLKSGRDSLMLHTEAEGGDIEEQNLIDLPGESQPPAAPNYSGPVSENATIRREESRYQPSRAAGRLIQ